MWIETQLSLGIADAIPLAQSVLAPGEPIWHLSLGAPAAEDPRAPTWAEVREAARGFKDKAVERLKTARAADVVGGAVVLGGILLADSAFRAVGIAEGLPEFVGDPANVERPDGYIMALTPARLVVAEIGSVTQERFAALPRCWSRVRALAQWTPEALAAAPLRFEKVGGPRTARWRVTVGEGEGTRSVDFGAHFKHDANVTQAEAIAARVASLRATPARA